MQLKRPSSEPNHAEFSVENDGEELSELAVRPIAFLYVGELHLIDLRKPEPQYQPPLHNVYIPVVDAFEPFEEFPGQYKGKLFKTLTIDEKAFNDRVEAFANSDGKNLNTYMLYFAVVDYKDKFGTRHRKVFDITAEQHELDESTGQRLVATYESSVERRVYVDGYRMKASDLSKIWPSAAKPMSASTPWGTKA
ncbi:hypothetical protein EOS_31920 [Caballeronia mineralivorans PML1(12)]|uniref:Uncharacterized protein n=1 Tax=Caballeronia mineralivorans PML1(12) TaxID=908627 RepID=A0A0J1FR36_9BURK|nr:hypothetical protein EOS_31920 [Caballeronia mineralivorans PML1(12)]